MEFIGYDDTIDRYEFTAAPDLIFSNCFLAVIIFFNIYVTGYKVITITSRNQKAPQAPIKTNKINT
jgi:hypothetical protein